MKRIKKYEELSKLISVEFKKGVYTNCFISKDEFEKYINDKRLFYILCDAGLLIFIKKQGLPVDDYIKECYSIEDIEKEIEYIKNIRFDLNYDYDKEVGRSR